VKGSGCRLHRSLTEKTEKYDENSGKIVTGRHSNAAALFGTICFGSACRRYHVYYSGRTERAVARSEYLRLLHLEQWADCGFLFALFFPPSLYSGLLQPRFFLASTPPHNNMRAWFVEQPFLIPRLISSAV
jgi:hypothetical protein